MYLSSTSIILLSCLNHATLSKPGMLVLNTIFLYSDLILLFHLFQLLKPPSEPLAPPPPPRHGFLSICLFLASLSYDESRHPLNSLLHFSLALAT